MDKSPHDFWDRESYWKVQEEQAIAKLAFAQKRLSEIALQKNPRPNEDQLEINYDDTMQE